MAIYIYDSVSRTYRILPISSLTGWENFVKKVLSNRIQVYKLLANANLTPPKTNDYIYADVFTDADGWQNTVDTTGTDAIYDSTNLYYRNDYGQKTFQGPGNSTLSASLAYVVGSKFECLSVPSGGVWKLTWLNLGVDVNTVGTFSFDVKIYKNGQIFPIYNKTKNVSIYTSGTQIISLYIGDMPWLNAGDYIDVFVEVTNPYHENIIQYYNDSSSSSTADLVVTPKYISAVGAYTKIIYSGGVTSLHEGIWQYSFPKYIKTKTFSLPSSIKQLLVFADRELINNPGEIEVEVYNTSDTLLASGTMGEVIDISDYGVSSVYLKLKLNGESSTLSYTICYGYAVAFFV